MVLIHSLRFVNRMIDCIGCMDWNRTWIKIKVTTRRYTDTNIVLSRFKPPVRWQAERKSFSFCVLAPKLIGPGSEQIYTIATCRRLCGFTSAHSSRQGEKSNNSRKKKWRKKKVCTRPLGGAVKLIRDLTEVSEPVAGATWGKFHACCRWLSSPDAVKKVRSGLGSNEWIVWLTGGKTQQSLKSAVRTRKCFWFWWRISFSARVWRKCIHVFIGWIGLAMCSGSN